MHTAQGCIHVRVDRGICAAGAKLRQFSVVTHLANWSRLEIQGVIRFLWAQEVSVGGILLQLVDVYGSAVMSRQQVANSCRAFASGRNSVTENSRSGRRSSSTTEVNTVGVEELVQTDRRVTLLHMVFDLSLYRKALSTGQ
jgi:hypothetical protein